VNGLRGRSLPGHQGAVVQERAGETTVLAVAYDVTVTSQRSERGLTFVIPVVG